MARPSSRAVLLCVLVLALSGCRLNIARVQSGAPLSSRSFEDIELQSHGRTEVLAQLGPPNRIRYMREYEVLEWVAAEHHGTDLNFFVPGALVPVAGPGIALSIVRGFFSPFEEEEEFRTPLLFRFVELVIGTLAGFAPFGQSQDVVSVFGRNLDHDKLLVVVDRSSRLAVAKRLELSHGRVVEEGLLKRAFLQAD